MIVGVGGVVRRPGRALGVRPPRHRRGYQDLVVDRSRAAGQDVTAAMIWQPFLFGEARDFIEKNADFLVDSIHS